MSKRISVCLCLLIIFSFFFSGCYYFSAKKEIANAEGLFSELKKAGGEKRVPYEYCSAEKFLEDAKLEFSQNDFGPAKAFAERSKSAAEAGLAVTGKK
jgi:hypothetical protein